MKIRAVVAEDADAIAAIDGPIVYELVGFKQGPGTTSGGGSVA